MSHFVLIPGGFRRADYFDPIAPALREAGHRVDSLTLPGLQESADPRTPVNLDTHVDHVLDHLLAEDATDVLLVAHSYSGMVTTGVALRAPERIARLVYLDCIVPVAGQSTWDLITPRMRDLFIRWCTDGFVVTPDDPDEQVAAQPMATFLQPVTAGIESLTVPRVYVHAGDGSDFDEIHERLQQDPQWECVDLPSNHDFVQGAPTELTELLLSQASPR